MKYAAYDSNSRGFVHKVRIDDIDLCSYKDELMLFDSVEEILELVHSTFYLRVSKYENIDGKYIIQGFVDI